MCRPDRGLDRRGDRIALVAFDFDGTLCKGDAGVHFAMHAALQSYKHAFDDGIAQGLFELPKIHLRVLSLIARGLWIETGYSTGRLDRHRMVERAYRSYKGLPADDVREALDRFARRKLPGLLRETVVDQMREHIERGDHVVVLSTGTRDLIWPLRDELGLDFEVIACRLRQENGTLTGTVEGPLNGQEKAMRLMAIAKRRKHGLDEAWAYSDHEDDAVILEMVGNPVAVHPTKEMRKIANRRGWPIIYD